MPGSDPQRPRALPERPVHLRAGSLALVAAGGAVGTAAREGVTLAIPATTAFPVAIFVINLTGAFVLGLLLEALVRSGPDVGGRRRARLLLGTGFCGGYTTYSALAAATALLLAHGDAGTGVVYALGTVLVGGLASWAGIACGGLRRDTR